MDSTPEVGMSLFWGLVFFSLFKGWNHLDVWLLIRDTSVISIWQNLMDELQLFWWNTCGMEFWLSFFLCFICLMFFSPIFHFISMICWFTRGWEEYILHALFWGNLHNLSIFFSLERIHACLALSSTSPVWSISLKNHKVFEFLTTLLH